MEIFQEPIPYQNPQLCIKVWKFTHMGSESDDLVRWHYHKEVEFILVLDGIHCMNTPTQAYVLKPGEVIVIGSSQLHRPLTIAGQSATFLVLHIDLQPYFDPAMMHYTRHFMEVLNPLEELNYIFRKFPHVQLEVGTILLRIHEEVMQKKKGYEIAVSMHIKHLLLILLRNDDQELLLAHEYVDADVFRPVSAYIEEHLDEKINMADVSKIVGMSYAYFSKYFKKKVGISFTDFVNRKRIAKAERMIAIGNKNVTDIAIAVGIENMAHFYELFKRFSGCTPRQYKQKMRGGEGREAGYDYV
ncbi:AraC family transcriptional regulator [Paenibacillus sp. N3.4]|uniref:helix-turn-helix domain-containing protein n=1 Tax=Paenibacillus sp. N3.4 TaxID=2603222 RepID=UPI0011CA53A5|nr:AraC family transcriptional regulator [Paenibacillus sp. N3.4]TXK84608.1 helix-turn-helix transcriptional regulator [Paenibacillus sp. N3.4]